MLKNERVLLAGLLAAAGALYLGTFHWFYVGFFNDDAGFVLSARALWQGRYVLLQIPGQPPMSHFQPGYPLFLMPFLKFAGPRWALLKGLSIALTLLSSGLLWSLLRGWFSPWARLGATALLALNPVMAVYSGAVLSDPLFLTQVLLILVLMRRALERETFGRAIGLGLAMAWAALTRPVGAILVPSVCLGLLWGRRFRLLGASLAPPLLIDGSFWLRNVRLAGTPTDYLLFFKGSLLGLADPRLLAANAWQTLWTLCATAFQWPGLSAWPRWGQCLFILASLSAAGAGFLSLSQRRAVRPELLLTVGVFAVAYGVVLTLWSAGTERYALPLLPSVIVFSVEGGRAWIARRPWKRYAGAAALALLIFGDAAQSATLLSAQGLRPSSPGIRFPAESLAWIRDRTSPEDVFLYRASLIYLYAGRRGFGGLAARDAEQMRNRLRRGPVRYVWIQDAQMAMSVRGKGAGFLDQEGAYEQVRGWILERPDVFPCVYRNPAEGVSIYQVLPDPPNASRRRNA